MSVFEKLKELSPDKPYIGFTHLSIGYHRALSFRKIKSKFEKKDDNGEPLKSILVELRNQVLFLPRYFLGVLNDADIDELNANIENKKPVYIYFGGSKVKKEKGYVKLFNFYWYCSNFFFL